MLRSTILAASRNHRIERLVSNAPVSRTVVRRFVGGSDRSAAVGAASALVEDKLYVTLDHLGEDTTDAGSWYAPLHNRMRLPGPARSRQSPSVRRR